MKLKLQVLMTAVFLGSTAFAQGVFPHFTYGGGYQSEFTFMNLGTTSATQASLTFFGSDGSALATPVLGPGLYSGNNYTFSIPPGGSVSLILSDQTGDSIAGWANLQVPGAAPVTGQVLVYRKYPGLPDYQAVEPMVPQTICSTGMPEQGQTLVPFDNTNQVTAIGKRYLFGS